MASQTHQESSSIKGPQVSYRITSQSPDCSSSQQLQVTRYQLAHQHSTNGEPSVVRWSSLDGRASADQCLQVQPLDFRPLSAQGQPLEPAEHRMVVDGDAYTLLILDCSPQPGEGHHSAECLSRCDCHSRCRCQTEVIVKQQCTCHDHVCQHTCQQHLNQSQEQRLAIENKSSSLHETSNSTHLSQQQQQRRPSPSVDNQQKLHQFQELDDSNYLIRQQQQRQPSPRVTESHSSESRQYQWNSQSQETEVETTSTNHYNQQLDNLLEEQRRQEGLLQQEQIKRYQYSTQMSPRVPKSPQPQLEQHQWQQQQQHQQQHQHQQQQQQQREDEVTEQEQQVMRQPRPGYRLVKRWHWNKERFVITEVPDEPVARPSPVPSAGHHSQPTDIWHQDQLRPTTSNSLTAVTGSTTSRLQVNQPGPDQQQPWLAYRVPDTDSVQSDPLYRDLMLELQRLEEGVSGPQESIVEPEIYQRPVFGQSIQPECVEVKEYEDVEFICRLIPNSDPSITIEWTLNGKPLQESSRFTHEHDFGVVRLHIRRCEAEDSGIYQCKAKNSLGEAISTASLRVHAKGNIQCETLHPAGLDKIMQLENPRPVERHEEQQVEQPPKFLTHICDYVEKDEGDSVHFECCLAPVDDPELKTEWFFNGRPLVTGSRFHTIDDFGFIVLDIDWLFPRDTGEYVCRASNRHGSDITRTVLRVRPDKNIILDSQLDNPQVIDKLRQLEFPDVVHELQQEEPNAPAHFVQPLRSAGNKCQFQEGENVHFEARVGPATDGELTVEWFHNDKPLISGHRFKPTFDFGHIQLDILYVYPEDSGTYRCVTRNATGMDVSEFQIQVTGKPSLIYQSQLPKEMEGGVQKIEEMEAMWNRPPDPEEEEQPAKRTAPQFVLKPKPCSAFEGSCARFCCRVVGVPKPRLTWSINGQVVVSGSRYKLTYDGMYHLIIPKCQLSDAGKVEVYARNQLGECFCATELKVKRKVDDYRGVLKNSPNPWYDEQSLKVYQRHRSQDLTDEEDFHTFNQALKLHYATEQQAISPLGNQLIGYMEPGTPDVNLLARDKSPLVGAGDLHPVVIEQQVVMAPAPSTIQRALSTKDSITTPTKSFQITDATQRRQQQETSASSAEFDYLKQHQRQSWQDQVQPKQQAQFKPKHPTQFESQQIQEQQLDQERQLKRQQEEKQRAASQQSLGNRVYGLELPRYSATGEQQQRFEATSTSGHQAEAMSEQSRSQLFDPRRPPPSPESSVHGKEVHSQTHKQTQLERRQNREIMREIIEKETFEQEHKGVTKDNVVRGSSMERGSTPESSRLTRDEMRRQQEAQQQEQLKDWQFRQHQIEMQQKRPQQQQQDLLVDDNTIPPEFINKIQPCQALDGDEARFECTFKGEPKPTISWYCESKLIKPSNLYKIETDLDACKSTLIIRRVPSNGNAMYTVKAENVAGSAKSSANLVVEPHPLADKSRAGLARKVETQLMSVGATDEQDVSIMSSSMSSNTVNYSSRQGTPDSQGGASQKVKSIRTRKISSDEMNNLIRASPEGLMAPTFLYTIHDTAVRPGELARLDARLVGSQPMEVKWIKDGERLRADRSHKMVLEGDLYTLLILEFSHQDEAFYECVASNAVGEARCGARLSLATADGRQSTASNATGTRTPDMILTAQSYSTSSSTTSNQQQQQQQKKVFGLPKHHYNPLMNQYTSPSGSPLPPAGNIEIPKLIKRLESQQVHEGKPITLRCQISAFPTAQVNWYKHGDKLIKPSKYFRIFKDNDETYCLRILEAFPEDQGEYKCVARGPNNQYHVETAATLTVIPTSPR